MRRTTEKVLSDVRRHLGSAAVAGAALLGSLSAASAENQTLKLYFVHTGEKASITFKRDGTYDTKGLAQINRLLRDWRRNEPTKMDPRLLDLVWEVHKRTGSREFIHVVSAYRSPETNSMLRGRSANTGVSKRSQHMLGKAMDFYIPGVSLTALRTIGMQMQIGGVGFYPTSGSPFVHLDVGSVRAWPRMSRQELARIFPDGRTLHMPADGRPLPGYQQALAEQKRRPGSTLSNVSDEDDDAAPQRPSDGLLTAMLPVPKSRAQEMFERQLKPTIAIDDGLLLSAIPLPTFRPVIAKALEVGQPVAAAPSPAEFADFEQPVPRVFFTGSTVSIAALPLHGAARRASAGFSGHRVFNRQAELPLELSMKSTASGFQRKYQQEAAVKMRDLSRGNSDEAQTFDPARFLSDG